MANFIDLKWNKLLRRARLFNFIPFVDFVLVAGSMAMGDADENSDFDVIVGVKTGRIFTVRAFCVLFFGLFGWRRKKDEDGVRANNKFCFSHFVAPEKYRLSEPYNEYWKKLYFSVIPIYGRKDLIQKFYDANVDWVGSVRHCEACLPAGRSLATKQSLSQRLPHSFQSLAMTEKRQVESVFEKMLSGKFGDILEKWLKKIQIKKIEKGLKTENLYKPRIIFNDGELEFHPRTKRIEEYINKLNN